MSLCSIKLKNYGKEKHLGDYYPDIDYDSDRYRDDLGRDLLYLSNGQLVRNLLHVVDELARMIPVGYGMADKDRNGYLRPSVCLEIFPELDKGKEQRALGIGILRKGRIAQPRQARDGTEIGWLAWARLDDARHIPVALHVCHDRLIERVEILAVFAPDIRKGLGLGMEQGVAGHDFFPISQLSAGVEAHPELLVPVDGFHDDVKHHGEKAQPARLLPFHERRDVEVGVQIILALDLMIVIVEVDVPFPRGAVYQMEAGVHVLFSFFRIRNSFGGVCLAKVIKPSALLTIGVLIIPFFMPTFATVFA